MLPYRGAENEQKILRDVGPLALKNLIAKDHQKVDQYFNNEIEKVANIKMLFLTS